MNRREDVGSGAGGGCGMSRAAKKRAKKQQKRSFEDINSRAFATKLSFNDDLVETNENAEAMKSENGGFNSKRIKSIIKKVSSRIGLECVGDEDGNSTENNDDNVATTSASIPVPELPQLPLDLSLTSILLMQEYKDPKVAEKLQALSAKQRGACLLQSILAPITLQTFYDEYWEKKPLLVRATDQNKSRYNDLLSLASIKAMTNIEPLYYGKDLNVTIYKKSSDGVKRRVTLDKLPENTNGDDQEASAVRVDVSELWSNYDDGCTLRLLCPHKHFDAVHALLSNLETELQCMVGANAYLTPPYSSQGFAPHYDDIEAFCLQLEGSKRWKVYAPKLELPRKSSEDFTAEDLKDKKPVMDITLEEGDFLYLPRGWIHQACTLKDNHQHSLHLTVSAMQQWAWVDLLEMIVPDAVEAAASSQTSTLLRQGLPRGFIEYMGVMYEDASNDKLPDGLKLVAGDDARDNRANKECLLFRERFRIEAKKRIMKITNTAMDMIDATCDQMAKRYISERQPPALTPHERAMTSQADETADETSILPDTKCRLVRPGVGRLVVEDDKAIVYHCVDNSREYLGNPVSPLEFEMDDGPALEQLLTTVEPEWISVNDLFHDTIEDKIAITQALYDEGILAIENKSATSMGTDE